MLLRRALSALLLGGLLAAAPPALAGNDVTLVLSALSADYTNATTTATEVVGLRRLTATGTYVFRYFLLARSAAATTGMDFSISHDGSHGSPHGEYRRVGHELGRRYGQRRSSRDL